MENEPIVVDLANPGTPQGETEAPKKRKYTKKKAEGTPTKGHKEGQQPAGTEFKEEVRPELVHYAHKLEFELISAKKKLKHQRKYFRKMINSLTSYLGEKGISYDMVDEYVQAIGLDLEDSDSEMNFEKLFTLHKYRLIEEKRPESTEPRKVAKKVSEGKAQTIGQAGEDVMFLATGKPEKPRKKKEKSQNVPGEAKPRKKKEKKSSSGEEHNPNSNSTAPTLQGEHLEPKEPGKKGSAQNVIQIEDEPEPRDRGQPKQPINKGLSWDPQQLTQPSQFQPGFPIFDFLKKPGEKDYDYQGAMQRALLSMNMNNPLITPQLLETLKNFSK